MAATAKTTKTPPDTTAAQPAAPATPALAQQKAEAAEKAKGDKFVRVFKDGKPVDTNGKKLPPQALQICNILEAHKDKGLTRAELIEKMKGVVKTKQPEGRILSYYQKMIQERGMVTFSKAA